MGDLKTPQGDDLVLFVLLIIAFCWSGASFGAFIGWYLVSPLCALISCICGVIGILLDHQTLRNVSFIASVIVVVLLMLTFCIFSIEVMFCHGCHFFFWPFSWWIIDILLWGAIVLFGHKTRGNGGYSPL
mmetsp:Transcript_3614/g.5919  ORF Transcript_3614/g.5919 Transcript_3614/m.5919 type:complete len:130 (+) Transcript_3614:26-415(+)